MKRNYLILISGVFSLVLLLTSCCQNKKFSNSDEFVSSIQSNLSSITVEEVKQKMDDFEMLYLVDVREPMEHNYGYIPGAINIPGGVLVFKVDNQTFWEDAMFYMPEKTDEIIVYCKKGKRSVLAADALAKL